MKEYIRRAINYDHMDLQYTFWQMFYLCFAPSRVYKTTKLHKQTKNQWARDDPAFVVVLACMVAIASLAYAVAFQVSSVWQYVRIVISAILFDFLLVGMVVATAGGSISGKQPATAATTMTTRRVGVTTGRTTRRTRTRTRRTRAPCPAWGP